MEPRNSGSWREPTCFNSRKAARRCRRRPGISRLGGVEWLLGYISAFDRIHRATSLPGARDSASRLPDSTALAAWVRNWCSEHPLSRVSDAAWAFLVGELGLEPRTE
jgi:hypothetical protein